MSDEVEYKVGPGELDYEFPESWEYSDYHTQLSKVLNKLQAALTACAAKDARIRELEHRRFESPSEDHCKSCGGEGIRVYGDTSTWHGGIGGSALTDDVCDRCWGSGNSRRPWPSHREFWAMKAARAKEPKP